MLKLFRYELRKTRTAKLIILGGAILLEILFLVNLKKGSEEALAMPVFLLILLAFCGVILMGIQNIVTLHRDMNTRQSHMLFMTPNSAYSILGAKVLECFISIFLASLAFFGLGFLDITLLTNRFGQLNELLRFLKQMTDTVGIELRTDLPMIASLCFSFFAGWIAVVVSADLADIVSSALLNGKKFNWLITILLFLLLTYVISLAEQCFPASLDFVTRNMLSGCVDMLLACGMYVGAAVIMDRFLSV